ncbi:Holliday junction branch migration protein RuvA [Microlunatus spumicola]|uniref:Holliday junction branch migration complex subunit RuvA n=1 Tax=Microlunatus spumicola TaxID=81499 RepID=A0ABP6WN74_9ACTN
MIAQVSGNVAALGPTSAVVETGGVGLLALCSPGTLAGLRVGQRTTLYTSLVVREDALTLFGFASADEREFFELLITATGVGPKLAQAALAVLSPDDLRIAIAGEDLAALCRVPGIGRKGAQRIVIELKDKINAVGLVAGLAAPTLPGQAVWRSQVTQGLVGLGWAQRDAEAACDEVEPLLVEQPDLGVPALMRAALLSLARP